MAELTGICGPYDVGRAQAALETIKGSSRGYLAVCDGQRDVCFQFSQGGLRVTARGFDLPRLGDWLEVQGELRPEEAARLGRARAKHPDEREALLALRVPEARIDKGARSLMGRLALDALCWDAPHCDANSGEAPFLDGLLSEGADSLRASGGMQALVEGLLARLRDVSGVLEVLASTEVSVVTTSESKARERLADAQETLEGRLLGRVLAKPGIHGRDLLEQLGCGEIALLGLLAALTRLELVKVAPLPRDEAARREQGELALRHSLAELPRRLWLAQAALAAGDRARTARHEARAGWLLLDAGRHREAYEHYGSALSQSPDDLEALRGRVQVLWSLDRVEEAAEDTAKLGRGLLDAGLPSHARAVLEDAVRVREKIPLERLLLEALIAVGERRGAQSLGRSLLEKLEKKGHTQDAQRVQAMLDDDQPSGGPTPMRQVARRASGLLKASSAVSAGLCAGLCAWAWLSWSDLVERRAYAQSTQQARAWLQGAVDLQQLDQLFPADAVSGSPTGVAVGNLRGELELLREDEEVVSRLNEMLRYAWAQDVEKVIRILDGAEARTQALRTPLRALRERADAHLDEARNTQRRLQGVTRERSLEQAYRLGRRLLDEFPNVPSVINDRKRSRVPIRIDSNPSGALVSWQGLQVGATPMIVEVNLIDSSKLLVERQGYAPVELEIRFESLDEPGLLIDLPPEEDE